MTVDEAVDFAAVIISGHWVSIRTETLAAFANDGWRLAHEALCRKAQELTDAGEALPLDLQEYIVAAAMRGSVSKGRGDPYRNFGRDLCIIVAVKALIDLGYTATRNEATENASACSVVAMAAERIGLGISEPSIAKIWECERREQRDDLYEKFGAFLSYDKQ